MLANAAFRRGEYNEAFDLYQTVLYQRRGEHDRNNRPIVHSNLHLCLMRLGRHADAVAQIDEALSITPDNASYYLKKCRALESLGQTDAAQVSATCRFPCTSRGMCPARWRLFDDGLRVHVCYPGRCARGVVSLPTFYQAIRASSAKGC